MSHEPSKAALYTQQSVRLPHASAGTNLATAFKKLAAKPLSAGLGIGIHKDVQARG
jgi:hypothetical protein